MTRQDNANRVNISSRAVGACFALAVLTLANHSAFASQVWAWGYNGDGETNVPPGLSDVVAISGGRNHSLALNSDGTVVAWGYDGFGETNVPAGLNNVVAIDGGDYHNLALTSSGTVAAWGRNDEGETRVPVGLNNVVAIAAGGYHNLALRSDGTVVAWGFDDYGETNVPTGLNKVVAIAAGYFHSMALKNDGTVVAWGYDGDGETNVPTGLNKVVAIAAGGYHNLALVSNAPPVSTPPSLVRQPASQTVFVGGTALFTVSASGTPPFSYQWSFAGNVLADATNATLVLNNVTTNQAGLYFVEVTNAYGSVTSSNATLTIVPAIPGTVTSLADSGPGSLRQAILNANAGDTINFAVSGTITLTSGELVIDKNLNIAGPGAVNLVINAGGPSRILSVNAGSVNLSGMTFANGLVNSDPFGSGGVGQGGGVLNHATLVLRQCVLTENVVDGISGAGGAIYNDGTLQVNQCTVQDNQANAGGGIYNAGSITVTASTVALNVAFDDFYIGYGSGIYNSGTLTANASTFSGNITDASGGGIYQNTDTGSLNVNHSTFANDSGPDIYNDAGTATVGNCLVANWLLGAFQSGGYNLISSGAIGFVNGINHDLVGSSTAPLDPQLLPLADNGGFTWTHAIRLSSPAIDSGNSGGATTDQRGQSRVFDWPLHPNADDGCDIGAYENHPFALSEALDNDALVWVTDGDAAWFGQNGVTWDDFASAQSGTLANNQESVLRTTVNGSGKLSFWWKVSSEANGDFLRFLDSGVEQAAISGEVDWERRVFYLGEGMHELEWIYAKNASVAAGQDSGWLDEVNFAPGDTGPQTLTVTNLTDSGSGTLRALVSIAADDDIIKFGVKGTITLANGQLLIDRHLRIAGPGAANLTISGNLNQRVFQVAARTSVSISGLTLSKGRPADFEDGGALLNAGTLVLDDCMVTSSRAYDGGGIYSSGSMTASNCVISGNSITYDGYGGGIYNNGGTLNLVACAIIGNSSGNDLSDGGGIYNPGGTCIVNTSAISGNVARAGIGGGVYNAGQFYLTNSTVSGNTATGGGGVLNEGGTAILYGSTISGNNAYDDDGGGVAGFDGTTTVRLCTISGNSSEYGGGGVSGGAGMTLASCTVASNIAYDGGGIEGPAALQNTIVSGNQTYTTTGVGPDCLGTIASQGFNLIQNLSGCVVSGDTAHNVTGVSAGLGPLADNGGPTFTQALLAGSPAIGAGNSGGLATDQRGYPRPSTPNAAGGDGSDIGAFELASSITGVQAVGADVRVTFLSTTNQTYNVEYSPVLPATTWTPLPGTVSGVNGTMSVLDSGAASQPQRFYRVRQ